MKGKKKIVLIVLIVIIVIAVSAVAIYLLINKTGQDENKINSMDKRIDEIVNDAYIYYLLANGQIPTDTSSVEVEGVTEEMLYGSILTDEERDYILGSRIAPVEESSGIHQIKVEEETAIVPIVKAITFYNWIKNGKEEKIREAIKNPVNYDTLREIIEKNDRYNTDLVKKLLSE